MLLIDSLSNRRSRQDTRLRSLLSLCAFMLVGLLACIAPASGDEPIPLKMNKNFIDEAISMEDMDFGATYSRVGSIRTEVVLLWTLDVPFKQPAARDFVAERAATFFRLRLDELGLGRIQVQPTSLTPLEHCGVIDAVFSVALEHVPEPDAHDDALLIGSVRVDDSRRWNKDHSMTEPCDGDGQIKIAGTVFNKLVVSKDDSEQEIKKALESAILASVDHIILHIALLEESAMTKIHAWSKGR